METRYTCHVCKETATTVTNDPDKETLRFDGHKVCPECYIKLNGADLSEIKEILLRIEKKIENKRSRNNFTTDG